MPWVSQKQERWGNSATGRAAMGANKVAEFNAATKGRMLPRRAKKKPDLRTYARRLRSSR